MGLRKRERASLLKEERRNIAFARLNNFPTSPRKMRLVADVIRGKNVENALAILKMINKAAANPLEKLLLSALANWQAKNEGADVDDAKLFVKEIRVDGGPILKRINPAAQGRAHRIRKRSNHVTIVLGSRDTNIQQIKDI